MLAVKRYPRHARVGGKLPLVALVAASLGSPPGLAAALAPVCVADSGLHCFDRAGLRPDWHAVSDGSYDWSVVAPGLVLAAGSSGLVAYSADGQKLWRRSAAGPVFAPRLAADAVYIGSLGGELARLDAVDGEPVWRRQFPGWIYSPALLDDRVVTGGSAGRLVALDRRSGELLWSRELGQELVNRPVEAGDAVIATTFDGRITMFDRHGETRWRREFGVPAQTPVIAGDRAFSALFDGRVVALALDDGRLLWQRDFAQPVELLAMGDALVAWDVDQAVVLDQRGNERWRRRFADELLRVEPLDGGDLAAFFRVSAGPPRASKLVPAASH